VEHVPQRAAFVSVDDADAGTLRTRVDAEDAGAAGIRY
jgi:hypothetical protein